MAAGSLIRIAQGSLLNARGRIRLPLNLAEWLAQATAPLREAPFTHEIVLAAQQLPLPHRDPADRFLGATAQVMDLPLVTSDDLLLGLGTIRTMKIDPSIPAARSAPRWAFSIRY